MNTLSAFISYTHDSTEHVQNALALSNELRNRGVNCDIDQYHSNQNWPLWMEGKVGKSDKVIVICSETYLRRWDNEEEDGRGLGGQWESLLTRQQLYESPGEVGKIIPVFFEASDRAFIPPSLRNTSYVELGNDLKGIGNLLRLIYGIPPAEAPPVRTSLSPMATNLEFFAQGSSPVSFQDGLGEEEEELFTNLFPVVVPEQIHKAQSKPKSFKKFQETLHTVCEEQGINELRPCDFLFENGFVYSFSPFDSPVWKALIQRKMLFQKGVILSRDWASAADSANKNRFVKLLYASFRKLYRSCGAQHRLIESRDMKCCLFTRDPDANVTEGKITTKSVRKFGTRTVFKAIPLTGATALGGVQHWKHMAFRHRFVRIGESWFFVLTPFWAFTEDGKAKPSRWQPKSSANMQKLEKNKAVLGHVQFWASILCSREDDLLADSKVFRLNPPEVYQIAPSIEDGSWKTVADSNEKAELEENFELE